MRTYILSQAKKKPAELMLNYFFSKNLLKEKEKAKPKQISNDKHLQLTRRLKIEIENDTI